MFSFDNIDGYAYGGITPEPSRFAYGCSSMALASVPILEIFSENEIYQPFYDQAE